MAKGSGIVRLIVSLVFVIAACTTDAVDVVSAEPPQVEFRASPTNTVIGQHCRWERGTSVGEYGFANCDLDETVVAGGCQSNDPTNYIISSNMYEMANEEDLPGNGENLDDVDGYTGWACRRRESDHQQILRSVALCCGGDAPSQGDWFRATQCEWKRNIFDDELIGYAACGLGEKVVSGYVYNTDPDSNIGWSHPYEDADTRDLPDYEFVHEVDNWQGWSGRRTNSQGDMKVGALCCRPVARAFQPPHVGCQCPNLIPSGPCPVC